MFNKSKYFAMLQLLLISFPEAYLLLIILISNI